MLLAVRFARAAQPAPAARWACFPAQVGAQTAMALWREPAGPWPPTWLMQVGSAPLSDADRAAHTRVSPERSPPARARKATSNGESVPLGATSGQIRLRLPGP